MTPYYQDDAVTIYHGDCRGVMAQMSLGGVDMVLTDPPYGIDYQSNMRTKSEKFMRIANDTGDSRLEIYPFITPLLKQDSVGVFFCSWKNYHEEYQAISALLDVKNCVVWDKGGGGIGDLAHSLSTDYELAIVGHKGAATIRGKRLGSVWSFGKVNPNTMQHPTEKPVYLMNQFLETFSDHGDLVLDPFMGSGTTLRAAKDLGRKAIGIELEEKYCEIAAKRMCQEVLL